jgi:hypothetical protein
MLNQETPPSVFLSEAGFLFVRVSMANRVIDRNIYFATVSNHLLKTMYGV